MRTLKDFHQHLVHSNYGLKEILYYWADVREEKYFYCVPGVVKENFGKPEIELLVYSNCSYVWGDYLKRKLLYKENVQHGCSPFVYTHIMNDVKVHRDNNLFILPRSDSSTSLSNNQEIVENIKKIINSIDHCQVYSYPCDKKYWNDFGIDVKIISDVVNDPLWQIKVNTLLRSSKNIYLPLVCSDVFYASLSGCTVHFYECLDLYAKDKSGAIITNSYAKPDLTDSFYKFDSLIREIYGGKSNSSEIKYLNSCMLSLKSIQSRDELNQSLSKFTKDIFVKSNFDFEMCGSKLYDYKLKIDEEKINFYKNYSSIECHNEIDKILETI